MANDEKIIATVIALDVSYRVLLQHLRDQLPGLAMLVHDELEAGLKGRPPGLPEGVTQMLADYAALLARPPTASGQH